MEKICVKKTARSNSPKKHSANFLSKDPREMGRDDTRNLKMDGHRKALDLGSLNIGRTEKKKKGLQKSDIGLPTNFKVVGGFKKTQEEMGRNKNTKDLDEIYNNPAVKELLEKAGISLSSLKSSKNTERVVRNFMHQHKNELEQKSRRRPNQAPPPPPSKAPKRPPPSAPMKAPQMPKQVPPAIPSKVMVGTEAPPPPGPPPPISDGIPPPPIGGDDFIGGGIPLLPNLNQNASNRPVMGNDLMAQIQQGTKLNKVVPKAAGPPANDLLSEIQKGIKLKNTAERKIPEKEMVEEDDLTAQLKNALKQFRQDVADSDSDNEVSDDEWDSD